MSKLEPSGSSAAPTPAPDLPSFAIPKSTLIATAMAAASRPSEPAPIDALPWKVWAGVPIDESVRDEWARHFIATMTANASHAGGHSLTGDSMVYAYRDTDEVNDIHVYDVLVRRRLRVELPSRPSEERPAPAPFTDEERREWRRLTMMTLRMWPDDALSLELDAPEVPRSRLIALLDRLDAAEQRADEAERRLAEIREAWGKFAPTVVFSEHDPFAQRIDAALAASPESVR